MGAKHQKIAAQPAFYAVDPEWVVEQLWVRLETKLAEMQRGTGGYVRVKEAAKILKMSEAGVRRLIEEGKLPAEDYRADGAANAQYRILKSDLAKARG